VGLHAERPYPGLEARALPTGERWRTVLDDSVRDAGRDVGVLVVRLEPSAAAGRVLAVSSWPNGGFYCEDVRANPRDLAGFLRRSTTGLATPLLLAHDDAPVWTPALRAAGLLTWELAVRERRRRL
jgi:hypothetical protein